MSTVCAISLRAQHLTSSRRLVSWGAARKTAREKIKKSLAAFFFFFFHFFARRFRDALQLTESLEDATQHWEGKAVEEYI